MLEVVTSGEGLVVVVVLAVAMDTLLVVDVLSVVVDNLVCC